VTASADSLPGAEFLRTWCVITAFSKREVLRECALACRNVVPHVLVMDDGHAGPDVALLLGDTDIVVLRQEGCRGRGAALLKALAFLRERDAEFMITLDAAAHNQPADLPRLMAVLTENPAAVVIGTFRPGESSSAGRTRFDERLSDFWFRLETGVVLPGTRSGFRAYPVGYVSQLTLRGRHDDVEIEVLAKAAWAGLSIKAVDLGVPGAGCSPAGRPSLPRIDRFRVGCMHVALLARRLLPWPHRRLVKSGDDDAMRLLRHPVAFFRGLLTEHATPAELAGAAAVGTFLATLPLISLHTVAILYVATRLRLNRVMAVAIQNICMPPVVPFLCVELGYFMRHGHWLREMSRETWVHQAPLRLWEWFLGSLVAAPLIAVVTGGVVLGVASLMNRPGASRRREGVMKEGRE
jgi:uncharacterized protein (DUF2062 family)